MTPASVHSSFSEFMERALYGPDGFFSGGRGAGRDRDFITSPELGPLFAAVLARALDAWWDELDRPEPFTVVEFGAASGALARDIVAAEPRCGAALRYETVEYDSSPPAEPFTGVILANELLDNLPFDLFERGDDRWLEVRVNIGAGTELLVPADDADAERLDELVPACPASGSRVPLQRRAQEWLRAAIALPRRGGGGVVD